MIGSLRGLKVEGLSYRHSAYAAVNSLSFAIRPGEVHCLMGPSGCGKTTSLRMIAGLIRPDEGRVVLNERTLDDGDLHFESEKRRIGLMFQDLALFPHLSVAKNIAFGIQSLKRSEREQRVKTLLERLGLAGYADSFPHLLSGGEQQRVALARSLAPGPELMLLDEPFSSLDTSLRHAVREETISELKRNNIPTLLVTHDPHEAIACGDCVHVMQKGNIIQSGTPDELYNDPANEFVAGFFGSTLTFDAKVENGLASTPLGLVHAPGVVDGRRVNVVFRADSVDCVPEPDSAHRTATITNCKRMGPVCEIRMTLDYGGASIALRKPSSMPHFVGMRVGLAMDASQAFVFDRP